MSLRRALVSILLTLGVMALSGGTSTAQSPGNGTATSATGSGTSTGTGLIVPVSGVADVGAIFNGTLLVERFVPQGNGIAAVGTVTGALAAADGTVRNVVFQATLPLDVDSSRARLSTDAALAQSSCDALHVDLAGTSVNVLGSTLGLNPVAFDVASAVQNGTSPAVSTPTAATGSPSGTMPTGSQPGTVTAPVSTNTTQASPNSQVAAGVATPGATTAAPVPSTAPQAQTALGSLLCAVNGFRDASNTTQLIQQLNGIVAALAASGS